VGTLTPVEGNMNTEKHISVLDDNLWPIIARHLEIVMFLDTTLRLYPSRNNLLQTVIDETLEPVL
jgi:hypothetical protein